MSRRTATGSSSSAPRSTSHGHGQRRTGRLQRPWGADLVTVNDLSGTDADAVNIELAGTLGGATGDGAADSIVVNATNGVDPVFIEGAADGLNVIGLAAAVVLRSGFANDRLDINTVAGDAVLTRMGCRSA